MRNRSILISGLGIAGPALAYWLGRYGFEPEIVESAPAPRTGGYMIDVWGLGFAAARRSGLLPDLRASGYRFSEVRIVDARGRRISGIDSAIFDATFGDEYLSVLRGDLALALYDRLDGVPVRFGDSIAAHEQRADGVDVRFVGGDTRHFDLVIAADGLHSATRRLALGLDSDHEKRLGYWVASFTAKAYPRRDPGAYVSHTRPGRQIARYALRDGSSSFLFVWSAAEAGAAIPHDPAEQKRAVIDAFGDLDWEWPDIRAALERADDLYFDAVSQIVAPAWSNGRVASIGDAACCPSLLVGEGAALAMTGAYVLAGELAKAGGDHVRAFASYETLLRPEAERIQRGAPWYASQFAPKSALSLWIRNQGTKILNLPGIGPWLARRSLDNDFDFPDYSAFEVDRESMQASSCR